MQQTLRFVLGAVLFGCAASQAPKTQSVSEPSKVAARSAPTVPKLTLAQARHVLNRFGFGPGPSETDELVSEGFEHWLGVQLEPVPAPQPLLDVALLPYLCATAPPADLVQRWLGVDYRDELASGLKLNQELRPFFRDHLAELALVQLTRHVVSTRQVEEVMVDFWVNHFNVFAPKGLVRVFAGDYVERALRPHALGRFQDLLIATARHPAMLIYLDNAKSSVELAHDRDGGVKRGGLNENYARELLELHTLGVNGGYTQPDVTDVARILTGWSIERPTRNFAFVFRPRKHDSNEKTVLGVHFEAGHGEDEGVRLLELLASHPATAAHLAQKLCARFVADDPPSSCVEAAGRAYRESGGEIRQVLFAIARDASFFSAAALHGKLKTPLEFTASALRALGARPDGSVRLARVLKGLGEPLLEESVPTGYPDAEPDWASTSGMLARMGFASSLGAGKAPGVELDLDRVFPQTDESSEALLSRANQVLLGGSASASTLAAIRGELALVDNPVDRRALVIGLLLGSPEFQRQ